MHGMMAEISGMAWYGDTLVLLPQYPGRWGGSEDGAVFLLPKQDILAYIDGESLKPLNPQKLLLENSRLGAIIPGFQGFEAIEFDGNNVYLLIEAVTWRGTEAYLVRGKVIGNLERIVIQPDELRRIPSQSGIFNLSDEALVVTESEILTFHEANGNTVNPTPLAHRFTKHLTELAPLKMVNIPYRISDATTVNSDGRFWVINLLYPGDKDLTIPDDPLFEQYGIGESHSRLRAVERLLELQVTPSGILLTENAPIYLTLTPDGEGRNWEGIVRLDDRGFLLTTDKRPETILAFVKLDE